MKANKQLLKKVNSIASKYSKWLFPIELQAMYQELEKIGVSVDVIVSGSDRCAWYYKGEEVENSYFIYQVYEGLLTLKNEYNIYFS